MLKALFQSEKPYHWKRWCGDDLELYRCQADGLILTNRMVQKGQCAGHKINQPAIPTWFEILLINLGVIQ